MEFTTCTEPKMELGRREDVHRPSIIIPADYEFVAFDYLRIETIEGCRTLEAARAAKSLHFARTGGRYATHTHGGSCHICGASAIYTCTFYHAKSNEYIHTGHDCADKLGFGTGDFNAFRKAITDSRDAATGKRKAKATLEDAGLQVAWALYLADYEAIPTLITKRDAEGNVLVTTLPYEEQTIRDIVGKLVKYGSISENAMGLLCKLVERLPERDQRNAELTKQRAEEKAAAKPCPTGRLKVEATVLKVEDRDTEFGIRTVMTVKSDEGWIGWGSVPSGVTVERDCRIVFVATFTPSDNDPKFGFFKRPILYVSPEEKKTAKAASKAQQEAISI